MYKNWKCNCNPHQSTRQESIEEFDSKLEHEILVKSDNSHFEPNVEIFDEFELEVLVESTVIV